MKHKDCDAEQLMLIFGSVCRCMGAIPVGVAEQLLPISLELLDTVQSLGGETKPCDLDAPPDAVEQQTGTPSWYKCIDMVPGPIGETLWKKINHI